MAFANNIGNPGTVPNPDGITLTNGSLPNNSGSKNSVVYNATRLDANIDAPDPTCAAVDTGAFTTADPTGTQFHGLPINFGKGRGNWTLADLPYFSFGVDPQSFIEDEGCGWPYYAGYIFAGGNFTFYFHNKGDGPAGAGPITVPPITNPGTRIRVTYNHSIVR